MLAAAQLTLGCGGPPAPIGAPKESVTAVAAPSSAASASEPPPRAPPIGKLPAGAVTKALVLNTSIEPLFGLTVTLLARSHRELGPPPARLVGAWDIEINRNKKTITTGLTGDELHLEGAGLGISWTISGPYDREQITVWPGEGAPIGEEEAIALATAALAAQGPVPGGARVTTTEGGTARIVFGKGKARVWARVGLWSRLVWLLGADP